MRKVVSLALLAALAGCPKRNSGYVGEARDPTPGHPDLTCPTGTQAAGFAPPLANEVWCQRATLQGGAVRHGPTIQWWQQYARKSTGAYFDGQRHGTWTWWYLDGALERSETYDQGRLDGPYIEYFANGQKKAEGMLVGGAREGPWTTWFEDGRKDKEGAYVAGEMDGPWLIYGDDGTARVRRTYRNGRLRFQEEL